GVRVRSCRRSISLRSLRGWKCFGKLLKTRDSRLKMRSISRAWPSCAGLTAIDCSFARLSKPGKRPRRARWNWRRNSLKSLELAMEMAAPLRPPLPQDPRQRDIVGLARAKQRDRIEHDDRGRGHDLGRALDLHPGLDFHLGRAGMGRCENDPLAPLGIRRRDRRKNIVGPQAREELLDRAKRDDFAGNL